MSPLPVYNCSRLFDNSNEVCHYFASSVLHRNAKNETTVRSRYKRQLIQFNTNKKWPTRTGMEHSRVIFTQLYHGSVQPQADGLESKSIRGPLCYRHLTVFFWLWPRASLSVNSSAIRANPAAHPLLKAHTSRMTRKAPSSTDDGLVWFEVRAQRACGKVAKTIPNWRVRETLLLVVLLVHVFGTKDGYSYPSGYPAHIWHEG